LFLVSPWSCQIAFESANAPQASIFRKQPPVARPI
jgi:hypothetical protein